jgi:hypothetical protein
MALSLSQFQITGQESPKNLPAADPAAEAKINEQLRKSIEENNHWHPDLKAWKLQLRPETQPFVTNRPMNLEIRTTNVGTVVEKLLAPDWFYHDIVVTDKDNHEVKTTGAGELLLHPSVISGHDIYKMVPPSQADVQKVDLAKLFDLSIAGKYTVTVGRLGFPEASRVSMDVIVQSPSR